jgi:hypothetical protein
MAWTALPLDTNPDSVTATLLDRLQAVLPTYVPAEGDPLTVLAEELGREMAATNARTVHATDVAIADTGESIDGVTPIRATAATISLRINTNGAGKAVPAGFAVTGTTSAGIKVGFSLANEATSGADSTVTVTMTANVLGEIGNGVPIGTLTVVTATSTVVSAEALTESGGAVEAETLTAYLDRLIAYRSILRPGGVLADDLAILARSVAGVYRALGIDNYNASTDLDNQPRTATVVPIDRAGAAVSAAVAADVKALLESVRETNFVITVGVPTYTAVNVAFTATAEAGADPTAVQAAVNAAARDFIDPGRFAAGEDPDLPVWRPLTKISYLDLAHALRDVPGVASLTSLTINGATADLALAGRAPLPASTDAATPSTVTGTVT